MKGVLYLFLGDYPLESCIESKPNIQKLLNLPRQLYYTSSTKTRRLSNLFIRNFEIGRGYCSDYSPLYSYTNIEKTKPLTSKDGENRSISWVIYSLLLLISLSLFTSYKLQELL